MTFDLPGKSLTRSFGFRRVAAIIVSLAVLLPLAVLSSTAPASAVLPTTAATTWQVDGTLNYILPVGDILYLGGDFDALHDGNGNSVPRKNLAAIDRLTGAPTSFDLEADNQVYNMTLSPDGQTMYIVGAFLKVDNTNRRRVAAIDIATGTLTSAKFPSPNRAARAVATDGVRLFVGGFFDKVGGTPYKRLVAYDIATETIDTSWTPEANSGVKRIIIDPDRIWVAGQFSKIDGTAAKALAAIDPITGALLATDHPTFPILDIVADGDRIFAAAAGPGGRGAAFDRVTGAELWSVWGLSLIHI